MENGRLLENATCPKAWDQAREKSRGTESAGRLSQAAGSAAAGVSFTDQTTKGAGFVHLFATERGVLEKELKRLRGVVDDAGVFWVSWPKKSSGVVSDITEDVIREVSLPLGFVDIKVCAVDDTWSGLKLMIRRENRRSRS